MTRILVISDLHLCENNERVGGQHCNEVFKRGWEMLQAPLARADFLIIAGDIAQQGSFKTYQYLQALTHDLSHRLLLTVGNKDNRDQLIQAFGSDHCCDTGHIQAVRHTDDASVLVLDSLLPGSPEGQLCERRIDWLVKQLQCADGRPLIVALHHPPVNLGLSELDEVALKTGRDNLLNLLRNYSGPSLIVSGHHHIQMMGRYQGVRYCIGPAFAGPPAKFGIWGIEPVFGPGPNGATALTIRADGEMDIQYLLF